jgi:serine/threonine-protein kinase HipA
LTKELFVYIDTRKIGTLDEVNGSLRFRYEDSYRKDPSAIPLSSWIPLGEEETVGTHVRNYFENLLPEGDLRDLISKAIQVSKENVFGFLEHFGGDMAGNLSALLPGEQPGLRRYTKIPRSLILEWSENHSGKPLVLQAKDSRLSISGAQDKISLYLDSVGDFYLPVGDAPSTHILKPEIRYREGVFHSSLNEAFVMKLAEKSGMDVPQTEYLPEIRSILVKRYDRTWPEDLNGPIGRLKQADLCQLSDVLSNKKYEAEGGLTLSQCFGLVRKHSTRPGPDTIRLIGWLAFNGAVGNMDGHAKNLSILTSRDGKVRLGPFYDLMSTNVYPELSRKMAFKIGGENRPDWLMNRHWKRFSEEMEIKSSLVFRTIGTVIGNVQKEIPSVKKEIEGLSISESERTFLDKLTRHIEKSATRAHLLQINPEGSISEMDMGLPPGEEDEDEILEPS